MPSKTTIDILDAPEARYLTDEELGFLARLLIRMDRSPVRGVLESHQIAQDATERVEEGCEPSKGPESILERLMQSGAIRRTYAMIESPRMVADESRRRKCSEAGKRGGGSPTFKGDLYRSRDLYRSPLNVTYKGQGDESTQANGTHGVVAREIQAETSEPTEQEKKEKNQKKEKNIYSTLFQETHLSGDGVVEEGGVREMPTDAMAAIRRIKADRTAQAFHAQVGRTLTALGFHCQFEYPVPGFYFGEGTGYVDIRAERADAILAIELDHSKPRKKSIGKLLQTQCDFRIILLRCVTGERESPEGIDLVVGLGPEGADYSEKSIAEEFLREWNEAAPFAAISQFSSSRARHFYARRKDPHWRANYRSALVKYSTLRWVRDKKVGIDWFLRPDTVTKLIEGAYDDRDFRSVGRNPARIEAEPGKYDNLKNVYTSSGADEGAVPETPATPGSFGF